MNQGEQTYGSVHEIYLPKPEPKNELRDFFGIIYRIVNIVEHKMYLGKTKGCFCDRYNGGRWWEYTHNKLLKEDYNRLGPNAFMVDVFDYGNTEEELTELEEFLIMTHNCLYPRGYNMMSRSTPTSDIIREKISASLKRAYKQGLRKNIYKGKKLSEEHRANIRAGMDSRKMSKAVLQIDATSKLVINEFYGSTDAANKTGIGLKGINKSCHSSYLKAGGYIWQFKDGSSPIKIDKKIVYIRPKKPVYQIDTKTGTILSKFASVKEASEKTGAIIQKIGQVCLGKRKTHFGYKWKYVNETT